MKLNARYIEKRTNGIKVYSFNRVDSTNIIAKKLALQGFTQGSAVVAVEQTAGRGRLGRTFVSKRGGVYFSVILNPQIAPEETLFITVAAAVAAARAIEGISGKKCEIKWVNDIYVEGKKVCGILTEGTSCQNGGLEYAVLGVGINLFEPKHGFSADLPLADSVFHQKDKKMFKKRTKQDVVCKFLKEFFAFYKDLSKKEFIKEYQQRSLLTGKEITYERDGKMFAAVVVGVDDNANLVVKSGEQTHILSHGDIQIVGMEQLLI